MKRKYYMRGMGIGVVVTALLCAIAFPKSQPAMTDEEVIVRAQELGYTKKESGVTADDIDKLKEKEQLTPPAALTPEGTPEPTPSPIPTPEPPKQPASPAPPKPTERPTVTPKPTEAPKATNTPIPTPEPTITATPTTTPVATPEPTESPQAVSYTIKVERGMTAMRVAELLESAGAVADAEDFVDYLKREKLTDYINVGTFTIPKGAGYGEIAGILTR